MSIHKSSGYWLGAILLVAALLRLPFLDRFPPSLYSDEVSQGYNAYSLINTGRDEYGVAWPVSFRSFGDWKPPLPVYVMIPSITFFGLSPYGVRLPSAIFGVITVMLMYFFTQEMISNLSTDKTGFINSNKNLISLSSAFFLAISPWHITQSRMAMLTSVALFFLLGGMWAFLKGLRNPRYWLAAMISFCFSIYSYYGMRLIVPFIMLELFVLFPDRIIEQFKKRKYISLAVIITAILLLLPLGMAYLKNPDVVFGRVKTVSIFHDRGVALSVWELISQDGIYTRPWLAQFFHNKPYHYLLDITRRFFEHLEGSFLFLTGDTHPPFQVPGMGVLYIIDLFFLIIGCTFIIKREQKLFKMLLWLIIISILPGALTHVTPAANRTLTLVVPFFFIVSFGVIYLWQLLKPGFRRNALLLSIVVGYIVSFGYFTYQYILILPLNHADWWHYGYEELVAYLKTQDQTQELISISGNLSVPYIFFLFYNQVDPATLEKSLVRDYIDDEYGFEHVAGWGQYQYIRHFSYIEEGDRLLPGSLLVVRGDEEVGRRAIEKHRILYPDGKSAFKIYTIEAL